MRYKDLLNKEDYQVVRIFEANDSHFECKLCGEYLPIENQYKEAKGRCKECHKFDRKCHHYANPEYARSRDKTYQLQNRQKINKQKVDRRKVDPLFNFRERLLSRISTALKYKNWKKQDSITKSLGCSAEDLVKYIESKFLPGMSFENRNLFHIDHIIPLSSAKTREEMLKLNHYTNLQPLWAADNLKKSNKVA